MDLSKLPKLSKTGVPPAAPQTDSPPHTDPPIPDYAPVPPAPSGVGPEIWFNGIIGLLCVFLGKTFAAFLFAKATGRPFHSGWTDGPDGPEIPYSQVPNHQMWTDASLFLFGVVVLLEVAVKTCIGLQWRIPRVLIGVVLVLAVFTTLVNLYACYVFVAEGTLPLLSGLAAAFGGYIVADAWRMLARVRASR